MNLFVSLMPNKLCKSLVYLFTKMVNCIFAQSLDIAECVENCNKFQKLQPVVCGRMRKFFLSPTQVSDKLAFSHKTYAMHPNGPKYPRNK